MKNRGSPAVRGVAFVANTLSFCDLFLKADTSENHRRRPQQTGIAVDMVRRTKRTASQCLSWLEQAVRLYTLVSLQLEHWQNPRQSFDYSPCPTRGNELRRLWDKGPGSLTGTVGKAVLKIPGPLEDTRSKPGLLFVPNFGSVDSKECGKH
jgi:hypothetical protein